MSNAITPEEWETELGRQLRGLRLRRNLDQRSLSRQAGVALNVVKRLESGRGATVKSLVRVLRVLERVEWLNALAPAVSVSPLRILKAKTPRQRASRIQGAQGV